MNKKMFFLAHRTLITQFYLFQQNLKFKPSATNLIYTTLLFTKKTTKTVF